MFSEILPLAAVKQLHSSPVASRGCELEKLGFRESEEGERKGGQRDTYGETRPRLHLLFPGK